jgi:hypothetical protein
MIGIHDLIGDKIVDQLKLELITNHIPSPANDEYLPTLIRQGANQADPTKPRISIFVNPGDMDSTENDPRWSDVPATAGAEPGWPMLAYEVGGGEMWWRRFSVDINIYLTRTKEDRNEARDIGMVVLSKVQGILQRSNEWLNGTDDFGEVIILMKVSKVIPIESGGPPRTFIWRHKLLISVLTDKP